MNDRGPRAADGIPRPPVRTVVVLGAFGRTGWRLISLARRRGWAVIAADRLPDTAQGYRRLDASFIADIKTTSLPVLSALGPLRHDSGRAVGDLLEQLVEGDDGRRLVWILGAAVPLPSDDRGVFYGAMSRLLAVRHDPAWIEKTRELELLERSRTRWTAVRPPRLRDDDEPGPYDVDHPRLGPFSSIGRATLAGFMLDCLERDLCIREAPLVVGT